MIDKQFTCRQMFRHACTFAECADMAEEKFCHETADIEWYTTPATVNSAFACEVYLKAILLFYNIPIEKKHKIKELYEMLPERIQEWTKNEVTKGYERMWYDSFGRELLENISDAFVEWRYIYEHDWSKSSVIHMETGFLTAFRNALREACCQLFFQMTWEEYKGGSNG